MTGGDDFDQFYAATRSRIAAQMTAMTGDREVAADVTQEAFTRAWIHWARVSSYQDPEGWVRRVAYRVAIGRWRRIRRVVLVSHVPGVEHAGPNDDELELLRALQSLPINQRKAIVLYYLAARTVEEVAIEMGAPAGTIKSWLSRGRASLATKLRHLDGG